jgi:hypothetical protein
MNCGKAGKLIAERTGDGALPFSLRLHLFFCPTCAGEARRMGAALEALRSAPLPAAPDFVGSVMGAVRLLPAHEPAPVSYRDWIIVGSIILGAITLSPLSSSLGWIKRAFGSGFLLPLNLVLGLLIAGYCALFIGTHMDEISEKMKLRHD